MKNLKVLIIAEVGVNHNGSIRTAKKMIDVAEDAGADIVKFQTFNTDSLVTKKAKKAIYQKNNTNPEETQFEMIKKLELNKESHFKLINYCKSKKINFLSTGFDSDSIDFLSQINIPFFKIPSGEITNLPYLRQIGSKGKPVVMSTGMSTLKEVKYAMNVLTNSGIKKEDITILHCNTEYPTPIQDVNLLAIKTLKKELGVKVGYSDHTLGIEIPIAAVAMGSCVIEKHFTLDRSLPGPDHKASIEPKELKAMIRAIRNIEKAMGNGKKTPSISEQKNILISRKSIVAKKLIKKGDIFSEENLTVKRPGTGISPMQWDSLINKVSDKKYKKDDLIK